MNYLENLDFDHIWFIEDDVHFTDYNTLIKIINY